MAQDESTPTKTKRERSTRYPGVPLAESVELCKFIESRGLDGLTASDIATALGFKNIKTNTFSSKLSAARQFGLLVLKDEGYTLSTLARSILHPVNPDDMSRLYRQALLEPPLYSELSDHFADKRVPEALILGNVLYHHHHIIASAKQSAAEAFLDSARFAGALGDDNIFRPQGLSIDTTPQLGRPAAGNHPQGSRPDNPAPSANLASVMDRARSGAAVKTLSTDVKIDLRLWGADAGKSIRLRAPELITPASFERLIQSLRLHLRIEDPPTPEVVEDLSQEIDEEADAPDDGE